MDQREHVREDQVERRKDLKCVEPQYESHHAVVSKLMNNVGKQGLPLIGRTMGRVCRLTGKRDFKRSQK